MGYTIFTITIVFGLLGLCALEGHSDKVKWKKFSSEHHCSKIGEVTPGYKTSSKTGYRCDDGMEYWR